LKVFIYGTLKRGFALHEKGLSNARFLGDVQTVSPYPLRIAADFFGPMMLNRPGEGIQVRGELFEIEDNELPKLDELEDVGKDGSFRAHVEVAPIGGGEAVGAIGFFKSEKWLQPIHSDCIADYQDRRFIPPWDR